MKKVIASVLSVAMVAAIAAGCNDNVKPTTTETQPGTEPVETSDGETTAETEPTETEKETMTLGTGSEHINLWSFTNEVPNMVNKYISLHPEFGEKYTVDVTIIATTNGAYQPALDAALAAGGQDAPDLYTAEAAFVLKYTQGSASQFAATYKELGIDVDAKIKEAAIAPYTIDIGSRNGEVVGLGYQATGGAMIYRA
ncbi:MAG: carbohydrate ABC transporter substrate-binding protein, partial [Lachnospiraceae bacterium]|nr:carbohydrate ABC transporter substrate-binding protein [Lachnospiraceae bacterium]